MKWIVVNYNIIVIFRKHVSEIPVLYFLKIVRFKGWLSFFSPIRIYIIYIIYDIVQSPCLYVQ